MDDKTYAINAIELFHTHINRSLCHADIEDALLLIERCAALQYDMSIEFSDDYLERAIKDIRIASLCLREKCGIRKNTILFYDGFGLSFRGLALIYIRALLKRYHVVYLVRESQSNSANRIIVEVLKSGGEVRYLHDKTRVDMIKELSHYLIEIKPDSIFIYTKPNDVVAIATFTNSLGDWRRYQINLTDHRFWLGREMFDICIEFRDFGAWVSNNKRCINRDKIVKLPYYPQIDKSISFLGYPDGMNAEGKKVVFSGGHLSKTISKDKMYYKIISYLLENHEDALFWYAGTGDGSNIEELHDVFPQRVFFTAERNDLFQVIEHSYIYISTYPISGGLMFQYAAAAGVPPLTLKLDDSGLGVLINEEKLNIIFNDFDGITNRIDELFENGVSDDYKSALIKAVQSEDEFCNNLYRLIDQQKTKYKISYIEPNMEEMANTFLDNINTLRIDSFFVFKDKKRLMAKFPIKSIRGIFYILSNRIRKVG